MDPRDHRSLRSGPALAVKELLAEWPYIVLLTFAKSGSVISSPEKEHDLLEQLGRVERVVGQHRIDALIISVGGNDVGFASTLKTLAGDFNDSDQGKVLSSYLKRVGQLRNDGYPQINAKIRELNLDVTNILISEYPGSLFEDEDGRPRRGCGVFETFGLWKISTSDSEAISRMNASLNDEVLLAAKDNGWHLVDGISEAFVGHGYCTKQSFWRFAEDSCDQQGDFEGIMHPNELGTAAYGRILARELRAVLPKPTAPALVSPN
jgi:lysophospholipase L1-like esterase